jgi:NhaA family Na+:H+ antiporter
MISVSCKNFMRWQAVAGTLMVPAAILGLVAANTILGPWFVLLRETVFSLSLGSTTLGQPLLQWLNQGGVSLLFFLVGLECKRAFMDGELKGRDRLGLPLLAALGGMGASAAAGFWFGGADSAMAGWWMVPMGADIALGLAVLTWLGERVPPALKVFFTTSAMFAAIGAAVVAAGAQGAPLPWTVLVPAGACLLVLGLLNLARVESLSFYLLPAATLWGLMAGSAVHAVLAALLAALFIPGSNRGQTRSPLLGLEQDLLPAVCCVVLPLLALANAGLPLREAGGTGMMGPGAPGIALGLFPAKALGVLALCWVGVKARACALPPGVSWKELGGAAVLGGAGFTVNVFLALAAAGPSGSVQACLAVMTGSAVSIPVGYALLRQVLARRRNKVLQRS